MNLPETSGFRREKNSKKKKKEENDRFSKSEPPKTLSRFRKVNLETFACANAITEEFMCIYIYRESEYC